MARSYDIESLIENAFINELSSYVDSNVVIKAWDDIEEKELTPMIKVKAQTADDMQGVTNFMCAFYILVDFGVFTSRKIDENGRVANGIRGDIRRLVNEADIVTLLNAIGGLSVYNNGVIPQGAVDIEDSKLWQKNLTVLVIANTTD